MDIANRIRKLLGDITDDQVDKLETTLTKYIKLKAVDDNVVNTLNRFKKGAGRDELVNRIESFVFNSGNLENICYLSFVDGIDLSAIVDYVIQSKNATYIAEMGHVIESLSLPNEKHTKSLITKLQDALIELNSAEQLYILARYSEFCDVKKIENALIKIGNTKVLELFATNVAGAHVSKIEKAIKEIGGYTPNIVRVKYTHNTSSRLD